MHVEKLHEPQPITKKNGKGKNYQGVLTYKKNHKHILCSFITKYSATKNIAFLSPFHLHLRMLTFLTFFLFLTLDVNLVLSLSCATRSVLLTKRKLQRLQIQRRKHNTDPAQNKTKKQEEHKE